MKNEKSLHIPNVAGAALGAPVGKEVAIVAAGVGEWFYGERGELSLSDGF